MYLSNKNGPNSADFIDTELKDGVVVTESHPQFKL